MKVDIKSIGLSTSAFGYSMGNVGKNSPRANAKPWSLEDFIKFSSKHNLGGVEAPLKRFVPDLDDEYLNKIESLLIENELFFIMDAESALDIEEIKLLIPLAKRLKSKIIRIKSSNILSCDRKKLGMPWREHINRCKNVLMQIAPILREENLKIAIENHQDLDSNDLLEVLEKVGSDVIGVNFDIGNAFATCEDPITFAEKVGSSVLNIHLKDYKIFKSQEGFRLVRCALGDGAVDFEKILPLLAKNSPDAKMVIELGALESRNIAYFSSEFWSHIQPRAEVERKNFSEILDRITPQLESESWQTPWEEGKEQREILGLEAAQFEKSLSYIQYYESTSQI